MAETERQLRLVRFGDFEVDLRSGELRKAGVKLKFGGQPFQVLGILLERPGEVVTREELQKRLWPDTFVDVDHNLNTAINKIREVLGDSAESPRFVETLPRRGYRFIAPVESDAVSSGQVADEVPSVTPKTRQRLLYFGLAVLGVVVVRTAGVLALWKEAFRPSGVPRVLSFRKLTNDGHPKVGPMATDGSRIYFNEPLPGAGSLILQVSDKGDKLAFSATYFSSNIWRRDLLNPEAPAAELIPSSRAQLDAQYSPDGKRIAFASFRSGAQGVWISNDDGSSLVQISNPAQQSGSPQWSPDGKKIAFDSRPLDRWGIYVADATEGIPKKLVTNISEAIRPHWSRDGKWIYFRSTEADRMGVYRCPASGGDAIALSKDIDGFSPQESFDGKTIYFASHESKPTLKKVLSPGQPATESEVDGLPRLSSSGLWTVSPGGIYFVPADAPRSLRYFDFATRQIRPVFEVDTNFASGLSVSSDSRWILYSLAGDVNSDIMLVDHFH